MINHGFTPPDSLPTHYTDDGELCAQSGQPADPQTGRCPDGCDHADHYSNDGHEACYDYPDKSAAFTRRVAAALKARREGSS